MFSLCSTINFVFITAVNRAVRSPHNCVKMSRNVQDRMQFDL